LINLFYSNMVILPYRGEPGFGSPLYYPDINQG